MPLNSLPLNALATALNTTGYQFKHHGWATAPTGDYGVYAEDSARQLESDNSVTEQILQGTVDYFTRDDGDTPRTTIQTALASTSLAWYLNSIQYEQDTGYIHYEWVWEGI